MNTRAPYAVACIAASVLACTTPVTARNPLLIPIENYDWSKSPKLFDRIEASPFGYFRFINISFSQQVCEDFADVLPMMPLVNLHGDAHLEQYAVTKRSQGLADFDDSSSGPAVIDLVRFGVSLNLACRQRGWSCEHNRALSAFLESYRGALLHPERDRSEPEIADAMRHRSLISRIEFIKWASALMEPLAAETTAEFERGFRRYVALMIDRHPETDDAYYALKKYGRIRIGVGSALDRKLLIRVEGPTTRPDDDLILEAKELRDIGGIKCVVARRGDALRVVVAGSRIGGRYDPYLAVVPRSTDEDPNATPFWVQSWSENYRQLDILDTLATQSDLVQVARAVGRQLGRGHVNQIAAPHDDELRRAQLTILDRCEQRILDAVRSMTDYVVSAWQTLQTRR